MAFYNGWCPPSNGSSCPVVPTPLPNSNQNTNTRLSQVIQRGRFAGFVPGPNTQQGLVCTQWLIGVFASKRVGEHVGVSL